MNSSCIEYEGIEWIILTQDRIQWQIVVNMISNIRVLYKANILLTRWVCEWLCSMEFII
jgi:hypothetical protein